MIIGIAGEICSGKSILSQILQKYHEYLYINLDTLARVIVEPGKQAYNEIVENYGKDILNDDYTINRTKLGDIVFSEPQRLELLNKITHKHLYNEVEEIIRNLRYLNDFNRQLNVIIDCAVLFEIGLNKFCDEVWYVEANPEIRLKRLMQRNNFTKEQALKRIQAQTINKYKDKCNRIIVNNQSYEDLEKAVLEIIKTTMR